MNTRTTLRWLAIVGFGGFGVYALVDSIRHESAQPDVYWALFWFVLLPFTLAFCGVFFAVAYFLLRRQYGPLCTLASIVAALVAFGCLISVPQWLGLYEHVVPWSRRYSWFPFVALPVSIALILVPFQAAGWTFRVVESYLFRYVREHTQSPSGK